MGDGKRLKELSGRKGITVRNLARETGISATPFRMRRGRDAWAGGHREGETAI